MTGVGQERRHLTFVFVVLAVAFGVVLPNVSAGFHDYDLGAFSASSLIAALDHDPADQQDRSESGLGGPPLRGYDDSSNVARASARLGEYRLAPRAIGPTGNPGAFAFEGVTGLASKGAARSALGGLDATSAQLAAANRAIGRATSSSAINVGMYGERVVVQITRPGANGYQLIDTVVARDGSRTVVQMAYDSAGRLVHYDPKFP